MRITRETLVRIAKETAQKRALADPGLVAAYLTGSVRGENPFLGNSTDIDIVLVHSGQPKVRREVVPVTAEIHLDIVHNPRREYDKPKELRIHPWLGPELYDPLPLYVSGHFFEFIQAGVRAEYSEPGNVLSRARKNADHARQIWSGLQEGPDAGPPRLLSYLKSINHASNAIALLTGNPLAERRFMLQFQERAEAAGAPALAADMANLLGGDRAEGSDLGGFLTAWEGDFVRAAGRNKVHPSIASPRLTYYKASFHAMLASESPLSMLWPLVHTWTLCAAVLPASQQKKWQAACETLGLFGQAFDARPEELDRFLDAVDEILEKMAASHGI
jgi:hypothetical protein